MQFLVLLPALLVLAYLWWRLAPIVPKRFQKLSMVLFALAFLAIFLQRALPNNWSIPAVAIGLLGSFWLVFLGHWLVVCVAWDSILCGLRLFRRHSTSHAAFLRQKWQPRWAFLTAVATLAVFIYGYKHQLEFQTRHLHVHSEHALARPVRIALLTDIHFDRLFPNSKMMALVDTLATYKPDAVFFAGDLADIPADLLNARGLDTLVRSIRPPLGFYASTGNHEAYMNPKGATLEWMRHNGMTLLIDSTACGELFCVTGRADQHFAKKGEFTRQSLAALAPSASELGKTWLVLDHQPKGLQDSDLRSPRLPDLILSGHTHAGQFFPWNFAIHLFWPLAYGMGEQNGVPWYVSSGFGQWGPPVRTGTNSEIVIVDLSN